MKVKHIVIAINVLLTIVGLASGWIDSNQDELTFLAFITMVSIVVNAYLIIAIIIKYWDRKIL